MSDLDILYIIWKSISCQFHIWAWIHYILICYINGDIISFIISGHLQFFTIFYKQV